MQEITKDKFDYSIVNDEVANYLKERISDMRKIVSNNATQIGEQLYLSQQKMADYNNGGAFGKWVEANGISKRSAYNYINRYNAVQNLHSEDDIETFENLSKSLTYDISKPSAPKEAVDAVMSGDITTHKEYKELERKLRLAQEENADKNAQIERLNNKPKPEPKVIEKTVTKEVTPSDYEELKREASITSDLRQRNSQTQQEMDDIKSQLEKAKADAEFYQKELSAAERIKKNNQKLDDWERDKQRELSVLKVQTAISIYSLIHDIQDFLKKENIVRDVSQAKDLDDESKRDLQEANEGLQRFVDKVNQILDGRKIIEGEFSE